jgi:hypothetical protein
MQAGDNAIAWCSQGWLACKSNTDFSKHAALTHFDLVHIPRHDTVFEKKKKSERV